MSNTNQDIKEALFKSGVRQWELAERFGISEFAFCRKLRKELPEGEKQKLLELVAQIRKEREGIA